MGGTIEKAADDRSLPHDIVLVVRGECYAAEKGSVRNKRETSPQYPRFEGRGTEAHLRIQRRILPVPSWRDDAVYIHVEGTPGHDFQ